MAKRTRPIQRPTHLLSDAYSYYFMKGHGWVMRRKGGFATAKIKERTTLQTIKHNTTVFGSASASAALVRRAFASLTQDIQDNTCHRRLHSVFIKIIRKTKDVHTATMESCLPELKCFPLCKRHKILQASIKGIRTTTKKSLIDVEVICRSYKRFTKRSFYQVRFAVCSLDFQKMKSKQITESSTELLPIHANMHALLKLPSVHKTSLQGMFYCITIECFDVVNGKPNRIYDKPVRGAWIGLIRE